MNLTLVYLATLKAGSGKSTVVKFIIAALGLREDEVAYITFTGKASEVLRSKGCLNAMTAHKLLYFSDKKSDGKFKFRPRPSLNPLLRLIVVDEISMLPVDMWELLLRHRIPVLALGDPFQIPPIDPTKDNHVLDNPHVFLDQVMRQAAESDIITTSMKIRNMETLFHYVGKEAQILYSQHLIDGMYFWADEIICATNKTRRDINNYMRRSMGRGKYPEVGDKIICLQNCWDLCSVNQGNPIINGSIGYINSMKEENITYRLYSNRVEVEAYIMDLQVGEDLYTDVIVDKNFFLTGNKSLTSKQEYAINKTKVNERPLPIELDYGYSITCHKAQGSSWGKVLVIEEGFPFDSVEHARWLYTACTRAEDRLVLITNR